MTKRARTETNRRNAAKSTGPKTEIGKARSALNRASHGLRAAGTVIPGERAEDFQSFAEGIAFELGAEGMAESAAANLIAGCLWRLARVPRYLASVASHGMNRSELEDQLDRLASCNEPEEIAKGKELASRRAIEIIRESIENSEDQVAWLEHLVEIVSAAEDDQRFKAESFAYETADRIGKAAGTPESIKASIKKPGGFECSYADIHRVLAAGTKSRREVIGHFRSELAIAAYGLEYERELVAKLEAKRESALEAMEGNFVIPGEADMKRVAAFESQSTRTLARLINGFRELRTIKSESNSNRPRIAVASIAKKAKNRKIVQT